MDAEGVDMKSTKHRVALLAASGRASLARPLVPMALLVVAAVLAACGQGPGGGSGPGY